MLSAVYYSLLFTRDLWEGKVCSWNPSLELRTYLILLDDAGGRRVMHRILGVFMVVAWYVNA